jgi:hypothetical protein
MSLAPLGRYIARHHLGLLALFIALGGTSYAVSSGRGGPGEVQACVSRASGDVRVAKKCRPSERRLIWSKQGVPGQAGPTGATGPAGPTGTVAPLEPWHLIGAAGEPVFTADWVEMSIPGHPVAFRKDANGQVFLKGEAHPVSGTWKGNKTVFTLPPGYRPPTDIFLPAFGLQVSLPGQLLIDATGEVIPLGNADQSQEVSFDGVSFFVD